MIPRFPHGPLLRVLDGVPGVLFICRAAVWGSIRAMPTMGGWGGSAFLREPLSSALGINSRVSGYRFTRVRSFFLLGGGSAYAARSRVSSNGSPASHDLST